MPSLFRNKVLRDVSLEAKPVEIQLREEFEQQEGELEQHRNDPQVQSLLKAAEQEAQQIVNDARNQAQQIIAEAQEKRDAYVEAARQEGIKAGYQEGFAAGSKEAGILKDQAESLLAEARKAYRAVMVQAEPKLLELSVLIAEKIIRQQVVLSEDVIVGLVTELLQEVHAGETFYLYVHPSETKLLLEARQELENSVPAGAALHIVPDKSVSAGGCRLETDTGYYDATIEGQLTELKKLLLDGGQNAESG